MTQERIYKVRWKTCFWNGKILADAIVQLTHAGAVSTMQMMTGMRVVRFQ
jgi:hypothetical protein